MVNDRDVVEEVEEGDVGVVLGHDPKVVQDVKDHTQDIFLLGHLVARDLFKGVHLVAHPNNSLRRKRLRLNSQRTMCLRRTQNLQRKKRFP
jgi:hypothetical protein